MRLSKNSVLLDIWLTGEHLIDYIGCSRCEWSGFSRSNCILGLSFQLKPVGFGCFVSALEGIYLKVTDKTCFYLKLKH